MNACFRGWISGLNWLMQVNEPSHNARRINRYPNHQGERITIPPGSAASCHLGKSTRYCGKVHLLLIKCRFWFSNVSGELESLHFLLSGQLMVASQIMLWGASSCSVVLPCLTLCDPVDCSTSVSLPFSTSQSLFKLISIELIMPSNHLILYDSLPHLPSIFPSIRVYSSDRIDLAIE